MPPTVRDLPRLLRNESALAAAVGASSAVLAVPEPARALVLAGLATLGSRRPLLVAAPTTTDADRLAHDLAAYLGPDAVERFPAWETLPYERVSPQVDTMGQRVRVIWRLAHDPPAVVVAPARALIQRLGPVIEGGDEFHPVRIRQGDQIDPAELVGRLVRAGYRREYQVEHRGEVAVRGSIVDVFGSTADTPVRIDLWGDEVDRLTTFAVADQRSATPLDEVTIFPARELLPSPALRKRAEALVATEPWGREHWERLAEGSFFDGMESWLPWLVEEEHVLTDLLPPEALVVIVDPRRLRDRSGDLLAEEADLAAALARTWGATDGAQGGLHRLHVDFDRLLARTSVPVWHIGGAAEGPQALSVNASGWDPVIGAGDRLAAQVSELQGAGFTVVVAADGEGSGRRMGEAFAEHGVRVDVIVEPLERGCILHDAKLAVLTEADVVGRRRSHRRPRPRRRDTAGFFEDLKVGDYVVHHHHGVARYGGLVRRALGGTERDYLLLEYRGGDKLYVPTDQIELIRHYTGGDSPSLHRMGGADFQRSKAKVRAEVNEIAQELVVLYQRRVTTPGHAFAPDSPWQRELEEAFEYVETTDQLVVIEEVKADMEADRPMDRLVCGDVGFGKTEVALRAVFKAVQDNKQVAVLVPTTLLAQQHHQTFRHRLAGFPVRVEVLSRFLTAKQARVVVDGLADGSVDVVIGTHKLLSSGVKFKDLGLLVVDEEQRFGVTHKELIKGLRADVDVLTLTATPIPRTLEMSLTGIRDLSLLNTPPADRQPILTYVGEYDDRAVAEAIRRELLREGQVFYVHNRVQDIDDVARHVRELVPEARVAVAHGQMDEGSLERIVIDFWEGQYDVLVCTTIIESGIDMPTVNTLVVDRADLLGLGQLHQLRGRVGRAGSRAYAYLLHPRDYRLTEEAYERLKTIGEATALGSGFRIAMRDLEIRGAGNLLGRTQSGHIAAVGYDLYCQMVTEAVAELKGETIAVPTEVTIDVPLDAHLPSDYVSREDVRLEAYRRLSQITTHAEVNDVRAEWEDRFGPVPPPAEALLKVARLRAECHRLGISEVVVGGGTARLAPLHLKVSQQVRLQRLVKGSRYKDDVPQIVLPVRQPAGVVDGLLSLLAELAPADA